MTRKKRAGNLIQKENEMLAKLCADNIEIIETELPGSGRDVGDVTVKKKNLLLWLQLCDKINPTGVAKHDVLQLKRKWNLNRGDGD